MEGLGEDHGANSLDGASSEDDRDDHLLGATLSGDALARTLVDTQTANELGLVRSEVKRLRSKVEALEREKDDMVDNFRNTTQILINRIKELEGQLSESQSRPQTAVVIERIENRHQARPPLPQARSGSSLGVRKQHVPEVLRITEEPSTTPQSSPSTGRGMPDKAAAETPDTLVPTSPVGETSICGNCGRDIPAGNLVSHSVYCYRNNYRCNACGEVISIRNKESHAQHWTDPARLIDATARRDVETVRNMAEHGVNFSAASHPRTGDTVLHVAAKLGDVELISFFMGYGVDTDPLNQQGETPLHLAAEGSDLPAVRLLVELGANLNVTSTKGDTPLMLVCRRGVAQAAKYLVEMRADTSARTELGDTPLQIAQRHGHQETVLALCQAGAPLRSGTPSKVRSNSLDPRAGASGYPPLKNRTKRRAQSPARSPGALARAG